VSTTSIVLIVLAAVGFTVALLWLVKRWFLAMIATARAKLDGLAAGRVAKRLDDRANFFGLASGAAMQLRGNGVLALYDTELIFVQLMIDRVIRIPVESITEITTTKGFKGKTVFRALLKVTWSTAGAPETAAWLVGDLQGWLDALGRARPSAVASAAQ
jgi:hypothetical protein